MMYVLRWKVVSEGRIVICGLWVAVIALERSEIGSLDGGFFFFKQKTANEV